MANFYEPENILMSRVMRDHLNTWPNKPVEIKAEVTGPEAPAMMMQQLASVEIKKRYINGSFIGGYSFAVYIAINAEDTESRFDALAVLNDLGLWLSEKDETGNYKNLPNLGDDRKAVQITVSSTPSIATRLENGVEEYQALFALEYKYSPRR